MLINFEKKDPKMAEEFKKVLNETLTALLERGKIKVVKTGKAS